MQFVVVKKPIFIKEQEAGELLSSLGIKIPIPSKWSIAGDILF